MINLNPVNNGFLFWFTRHTREVIDSASDFPGCLLTLSGKDKVVITG